MIAQIKIRRGTTTEWAAASPVVLAAGEPGWDSTLKGMKVGDGSTEWAALPWIDAKNRPDINADTLDGVHLADIRLGQNILHNWDFRNPVNQRGVFDGFVSGYSYTFDRWLMSGSVWISLGNAVVLTVYNGTPKYIDQRIEQDLRGRQYTLSVDIAGVGIKSVVLNYPADGSATHGEYNGLKLMLERTGLYDTVSISNLNPSVEYGIKRVKLELGTVSTLHLDPPMDYGVELAKCQRYFIRLKSGNSYGLYSNGVAIDSSSAFYPFSLPCPMRVLPSIDVSGSLNHTNITVISMSGSILHVRSMGAYTQDKAYPLFNSNDANAYIDLSSDL